MSSFIHLIIIFFLLILIAIKFKKNCCKRDFHYFTKNFKLKILKKLFLTLLHKYIYYNYVLINLILLS